MNATSTYPLQLLFTFNRKVNCCSTFTAQNTQMAAPNYSNVIALRAARSRIQNPPDGKYYEHHVGSWACTMLKQVYYGPSWIITPEKTDTHSKKKPDLVVERATPTAQGDMMEVHLLMELKSNDSAIRFEEALAQVVFEIEETMEDTIEVFVVVQCGMRIGFFEYHNDQSILNEEGIPHFRGCISLTQSYHIGNALTHAFPNHPQDLGRLRYDYDSRLKDEKRKDIRDDARDYQVPCIFDIARHENDVNALFHHMVSHAPRSSSWGNTGKSLLKEKRQFAMWRTNVYLDFC